jgi:hypothetical protein
MHGSREYILGLPEFLDMYQTLPVVIYPPHRVDN